MNDATRAALPEPGVDRWWKVELDSAKSNVNPIKVTLMEKAVSGGRVSRPLAFDRTVATSEAVGQAAKVVLIRVGDYASVVGEYAKEQG